MNLGTALRFWPIAIGTLKVGRTGFVFLTNPDGSKLTFKISRYSIDRFGFEIDEVN